MDYYFSKNHPKKHILQDQFFANKVKMTRKKIFSQTKSKDESSLMNSSNKSLESAMIKYRDMGPLFSLEGFFFFSENV